MPHRFPPTPVGWPSTYIEECADMAQIFQAQVLSLISEGAFARFPELRVVLIESGFVWMPAWMWRMDKEWKGLRRDTPLGCAPPIGLRARTHPDDTTTNGRAHKFRTPFANDWTTGLG